MSFGISKTIPASQGEAALESLYDGSVKEFEFHMAGSPSKLEEGHYVYTIYNDQMHGRCKITRLVGGAVNPSSGKPRTLIYVACPGERLDKPIAMKGHRGTRYQEGEFWPG
ncbi:MAG: hypothetical protein DWQ07_12230 [Chloroflexi bacterium]|nr:MAG: hypothetical protein DWQ07_12230 [Chloroflexota bacterium]